MDATLDTIEMTREVAGDLRWRSHAEYLQRLHREASTALARLEEVEQHAPSSGTPPPPSNHTVG